MSKKKVRKPQKLKSSQRERLNRRKAIVIGLILCSGLTALIFARWAGMRSASSRLVPLEPQTSQSPSLSKEYIYAGGKLVAIEEPAPPLPPPTNLVATTQSGSQVNITWTASTGNVDHYQVERSTSLNGTYAPLSPNPTTTSFIDMTTTGGAAYLYRVCAVDASGGRSAYSNADFATAISFTDDPLVAGNTPIKAQHLTEIRQAINAMRATAGLAAASWTDPSLAGVQIKAVHIQELRLSLNQARSALGGAAITYTDSTLSVGSTLVKKVHIEELRQWVK